MHQRQEVHSGTANKLTGIEALRGIAAALVVFSHAARHVDRAVPAPNLITLFEAGHAGVDLFFTLSGFIILFVHRRDVGRRDRLGHYAARRFDRVMPLYWLALAITLGLSALGGHALPPAPWLAWWAALLPTIEQPLFGIAWTLQYEALFYVGFGVLIAWPRVGMALLAAWLLAIVLCAGKFIPSLALCQAFGLDFLFGMIAAELLHRVRLGQPLLLAATAGGMFTSAYVLEAVGLMDGYGVIARFAYGIPAAMLMLGVAAAERAGSLVVPRWLSALGSASYSIYLFQFVFIGITWQALLVSGQADRLPASALFLLLAGASLLGGVVVARTVERPLQGVLRRHGWTIRLAVLRKPTPSVRSA